jgi:hypothetical protein
MPTYRAWRVIGTGQWLATGTIHGDPDTFPAMDVMRSELVEEYRGLEPLEIEAVEAQEDPRTGTLLELDDRRPERTSTRSETLSRARATVTTATSVGDLKPALDDVLLLLETAR